MKLVSRRWLKNQREIASAMSAMRVEVARLPYGSGDEVAYWTLDNLDNKNLVDCTLENEFDYSRATLPFPSFNFQLENEVPDDTYNFVKAATPSSNPLTAEIHLGYRYDPSGVETVPMTQQIVIETENSDDDLLTRLSALGFTNALDDSTFYNGRYEEGGIPASTLFAEILDDADLPARGWWKYVLGRGDCETSETTPLWDDLGYSYYHIDPAFDSVMVEIPIPPMSHRRALTVLAAYVGAYLIHRTDGSLHITPSSERVVAL